MAHKTHVRITQHAHGKPTGTGEDIHYKPGDIHEVGSDTMSETLAMQLMGDGYAEPYEYAGLDDTVAQVGDFGGPVAAASPQQPNEGEVPLSVIPPRKSVADANAGKGAKKETEPEKHHGKHTGKHEDASSRHTGTYSGETTGTADNPDTWGSFSDPRQNP